MTEIEALRTLEHALELVKRIEAMINAPYWTSERREKIAITSGNAIHSIKEVQTWLKSGLGPHASGGAVSQMELPGVSTPLS